VAGLVDEVFGWRVVYAGSAVVIAVLTVVLRARLPLVPVTPGTSYPRLLASIGRLIRDEGFLRRRMVLGFVAFACTQLLWSAVPLLLSRSPYSYSSAQIGLFGLLGAAGALVAHGIGRLHDRGLAHQAAGVLVVLIAASWLVMTTGGPMIAVLIGIALSSATTQGLHVLNQARLFRYPPEQRSRVTTAYMTSYFVGGTVGGGLAAPVFAAGGWLAITASGLGLCALAAGAWIADRRTQPSQGGAS
jgi:predicted MFS family arabinose efflux permease